MKNDRKYAILEGDFDDDSNFGDTGNETIRYIPEKSKRKKRKKGKKRYKKFKSTLDDLLGKTRKRKKEKSKRRSEWEMKHRMTEKECDFKHRLVEKGWDTTLEMAAEVVVMYAESRLFPNGRNGDN